MLLVERSVTQRRPQCRLAQPVGHQDQRRHRLDNHHGSWHLARVEAAAADAKPTIINIQPASLKDTMKSVIRRTVGRAKGDVPQGPCPETFDSATELVVSVSKNYACEAEALHHFVVWAKRQGCNVISVPYEDARAALGL